MMSNDIERKVVVIAPRTMRAAQITAFRRPIQVDEDAALAGFDQGELVTIP
jgi:hypothetical protein